MLTGFFVVFFEAESVFLRPLPVTLFKMQTKLRNFILCLCCTSLLQAQVVINEFMALNTATLQDEDGNYSDWVELYNQGDEPVNLSQWCLTDNIDKPTKFRFPDTLLQAKSYMLVFLSDKDQSMAGKQLHASFGLSGNGEYLGLLDQDRAVVHEYAPAFPTQYNDVSYGLINGKAYYLYQATPGSENVMGSAVVTPTFSEEGGYKDQAFQLSLQANDGLKIYYSLDGSYPDQKHGTLYTRPILIDKTSVVSARCQSSDNDTVYSPLVTRSYFFLSDIVLQTASPEGYPQEWSYLTDSTFYPADYGMDSSIYDNAAYRNDMLEGFLAIPTVSIVCEREDLFSHSLHPDTGGIYIHTGKSYQGLGDGWERPASVEYYDPKSGRNFQINCGLRLHGGNSRNPNNSPKHSFRISFRSEYGATKLNCQIFDDETATDHFDHLILRAGYNYTWIKNGSKTLYPQNIIQRTNAQYIYDSFAKEVQLAMGHPATHSRFVHLYLNGLYWGLYDICEKTNDDFIQAYLGGDDSDYDVIGDHNEIIDGNDSIYQVMYKTACSVGSKANDENYKTLISKQLLDLDNYIDYMLINYYIGNNDWDSNNWRCARSRKSPRNGFVYFVWDAEDAFTDVNINRVSLKSGHPTQMMAKLKKHPEFKMRFADRVQLQLFDGGPLTPAGASTIYSRLAEEIQQAIVCESARWGDYRQKTGESDVVYTRDDFWTPRKEDLLQNYFPQRTQILLQQLRDAGLYPNIDAPQLSLASGTYPEQTSLEMTADNDIYYTTNGNDPRAAYTAKTSKYAQKYSGSLELSQNVTIMARCLKNGEWSALVERKYKIQQPVIDGLQHNSYGQIDLYCRDGVLLFDLPQAARVGLSIYDMQGRCVARKAEVWMQAGEQRVETERLAQGIYLYRLSIDGQTQQGKFRY